MNIIFSDQGFPKQITKSLFLAGPSPRDSNVFDWKFEAVSKLEDKKFDGTIFVPIISKVFLKGYFEYRKSINKQTSLIDEDIYNSIFISNQKWNYDNQVEWEIKARNMADINLFWVDRDINGGMPGFTTNIEFGEDLSCGKMIYGRPDKSDKCNYLDKRIALNKKLKFNDLDSILNESLNILGDGAYRENGEVHIPLLIWNTLEFKNWYENLKISGNSLIFANLKSIQFIPVKKGSDYEHFLFSFMMDVHIWIEKEQRLKSNEFIFSRKNISTVVSMFTDKDNSEFICLVKEFRASGNNKEGYVYELPSGSSFQKNIDPKINAQKEMYEETGLSINDYSRFIELPNRQLVATLSIHQAQPYAISLTQDEFNFLKNQTLPQGETNDSEVTFVEIVNLKDIFNLPIDSSMLGMIFEGVSKLRNLISSVV
jgi:hypothetical protein